MAALARPDLNLGRRAALGSAASLSLTFGRPPLAAHAATPIEKGAPAFGTAESRTGLLDGIKSAFSEKTGEELALEYGRSPADVSGVTMALPPAFAKARDVAIIFHGSGGPDRETEAVLERFRAQDPHPHLIPNPNPNPSPSGARSAAQSQRWVAVLRGRGGERWRCREAADARLSAQWPTVRPTPRRVPR